MELQFSMGSDSAPLPVEIVRPRPSVSIIAGRLVASLVGNAIQAAALMVLLGLAHERINPAIPALGYADTWLVMIGAYLLAPRWDNGLWTITRVASKS